MLTKELQRLREIKTFPALVKYLRDELAWPIESDDFDDLTFDYEPEELGIDKKTAVNIREIKQLRPLSSKQPWGIFFIDFEPKHLPIVVLRRILRSLVIKKRASAHKSQQAAWKLHDLLFISSYGESNHREITFAHFSEPQDRHTGDLPTLRVLGWDAEDTILKLDHVAHKLSEKLCWPEVESDVEDWRKRWSDAFELRHRQVITTSKELAILLADLAKSIRQRANLILAVESERGPLRKLHKAFQTALIHDLKEDDFADMYAQTIAYGLLAARVSRPVGIIADNLADMVPITNPFLKEMLGTFLTVGGRKGKIDFDELGVQEVVDLLNSPETKMDAVLRDFGKKNMQEDPVVHFYELFLKEYDKKKKVERGVFYTPQPVVSYIVRSVHELLQTEFGLNDGLADITTWGEMAKKHPGLKLPQFIDESGKKLSISPNEPFVQILDPATGTATFLVEVIDTIHHTLLMKWTQQHLTEAQQLAAWNEYVPKHLLPRLHAYELMMAPYAIAHMKIGLKLAETGYHFSTEERARIYLTNALEPWIKQLPLIGFDALAHEAAAVNEVKKNKCFTVVIGNPPYANFGQLNKNSFILGLLEDYKRGLNERKLNLDDDYIKFIRFGHHLLDSAHAGVFGMITNNVYLDGITHRQMRNVLRSVFELISICDLHGSVKKLEKAPDGSKDENVFDIQQGVGLTFMVKGTKRIGTGVRFREIWGTREVKYAKLSRGTLSLNEASEVVSDPPYYFFSPKVFTEESLWNQWLRIPDAMPIYATGIKTHLDDVLVGFSSSEIGTAITEFIKMTWRNVPISSAKRASPLRKAILLKQALRDSGTTQVIDYAYRALDTRKVAYLPTAIEAGDHRYPVMQHLLSQNIALVTTRQLSQGEFSHVLVTRNIADMCLLSTATKECCYVFPLKLLPAQGLLQNSKGTINLSHAAKDFLKLMGGDSNDFVDYVYAVFHSPCFRSRYAEFLKIDFPRLPLTENLELFRALVKLGRELANLHLMESPKLKKQVTKFIGKNTPTIERVSYSDTTVWVDKAKTLGFKGVPETVWNFHIGGYQVCEKWLKDRKGRMLSQDDINHYHRIVVVLGETIRIMNEIDRVIDAYGGWPEAFSISKNAAH